MDPKRIEQVKEQFDLAIQVTEEEKIQFWYARDLMKLLGYSRWENFEKAIERAKESCETTQIKALDHFREVTKMVSLGSGANRKVKDYMLTRYACTIAAKNLATEMTNYNVENKDLFGEAPITNEHVQNNIEIRKMLGGRGIKPEELPPAEDIKKLERRTKSQDKKMIEETSGFYGISGEEGKKD